MDGVDTSIYGNIQQPNALQSLSTSLGAVNQINQNKLFQQEFQARQGLGQAAQAAIGPDGQFDPNAYAAQLAQNKNTSYMAAKGLKEGLEVQQQQLQNKIQAYSVAQKRIDMESQGLLPLINNPSLKKSDIHGALADTVVNSMDDTGKPLITAAQALDYIGPQKDEKGNVIGPGLDDLPENPQVLNNYLKQKYARNQAQAGHVSDALNALYSKNLALAPNQQVVGTGPDGRPQMTANVNAAPPATSQAGPSGQPGPAGTTAVQPAPLTPMKGADLGSVFQPPVAPAPAAGQAPSSSNNVQLSLPPGQEEMLNAGGHNAAGRVADTIGQAKNSRVLQDIDQQTMSIAQALGSGVGPVSTEITSALGKLADAPVIGPLLKAAAQKDPTDTAGQLQILQKYLARRAQLGGQAVGAGTDFTQGLNLEAQPHDKQFSNVMEELARYNMALDMMTQGKATAMQNFPGATSSPAANEAFENKFRNIGNVDVYRLMLAAPDKQAALVAKMGPAEKKQLILDRRELLKLGAIPPQMQAQGQPAQAPQGQ